MEYVSTRGGAGRLSFLDAVMTGLAPDRGLLIPADIPDVRSRLSSWRSLSYADLACEVIGLYADLPPDVLRAMVKRSYATFDHSEVTPLVTVGDRLVLELFHGPTLAFKDIALQFLGNLFEYALSVRGGELNILGATSGDTGSAAIAGVRGRPRIRIFIMYPHGRTSAIQERQMTTVLDDNVFNLAIDGTFDDCQALMKSVFADQPFKRRYSLGAVNSVNWARVLAQTVYYFFASFRAMDVTGADRVQFAVPTGNFGDIFAGWIAARMGAPIERLILATNENDILTRFFQRGDYTRGNVHASYSPAMDIQVASNFERYLYYACGEDSTAVRLAMETFEARGRLPRVEGVSGTHSWITAGSGSDAETVETIRRVWEHDRYLLDPHTAVGVNVGDRLRAPGLPLVCLSTAHPAKFPEVVRKAIGEDRARHPAIETLSGLPTRRDHLPAHEQQVRDYLASRIGGACA